MESFYVIFGIILGWLFGILSPGIINHISEQHKKKILQKIIISELEDTRRRLSWFPFAIHKGYGTLDLKLFKWLKKQTRDFTELEDYEKNQKHWKKLNSTNDEELQALIKKLNFLSKKDNPALHFKKMDLSIINSNLINVGMLNNEFITKLLEIKFQINALNEETVKLNNFLKMTFDSSISENNHRIIRDEISRTNLIISEKAFYIVEKINTTLKKYSS